MKTKSVSIILLAFLLTSCSMGAASNTNQEGIVDTAVKIADFDLPAGYYPEFNSALLGYEVAAYSRGDGPSHIYLIQSDNPADADMLAQALDEIVIGSDDPYTQLTVIETRPVVVRGEETTLIISEAVNSEELAYRQAAVSFKGNGGPALLVFSESLENWDTATLDNLISSIR